ncbi:MAG TPA: squalene synthase HpnC [Burkholderiaceae bacterium]|nr:squalene synthase HpnC [Burkholderiaceae bacterium]
MSEPLPRSPLHAVDHYENFPVASILMPRRLRPAVVAIYRFARYADDVADEGDSPAAARLAELASLRRALEQAACGAPVAHPVVAQLLPAAAAHRLDWQQFHRLLSAFEQDVTVRRYPDRDALLDYCNRSANPVGRLVLSLFGAAPPAALPASDAICTALQLINFLQDLPIDWRKGRLYLPLDALAAHGVREADVDAACRRAAAEPPLRALVAEQAQFARRLLDRGTELPSMVPRRLAWELRAIIAGGLRILQRIERLDHDVFAQRPVLRARDAFALAATTLRLGFAR